MSLGRLPAKQAVAYWAMKLGAALVPRLSESTARVLAEIGGAVSYALAGPARRASARNLSALLDPGDPDLIALRVREAFRTQTLNYVDLFRLPHWTLDEITSRVELIGVEHLRPGTILVTIHLGNLDVVLQRALSLGYGVTVPVEPIEPPELLELVLGLRSAHGLTWAPIGPTTVADAIRALKDGQLVPLAIDRDTQATGVRHRFFGRTAKLSHAPALLARRTGAPIVPVWSQRLPGGRYRAELCEPIVVGRGREGAARAMDELVAQAEEAIRRRPGQWVMFQRLFDDG